MPPSPPAPPLKQCQSLHPDKRPGGCSYLRHGCQAAAGQVRRRLAAHLLQAGQQLRTAARGGRPAAGSCGALAVAHALNSTAGSVAVTCDVVASGGRGALQQWAQGALQQWAQGCYAVAAKEEGERAAGNRRLGWRGCEMVESHPSWQTAHSSLRTLRSCGRSCAQHARGRLRMHAAHGAPLGREAAPAQGGVMQLSRPSFHPRRFSAPCYSLTAVHHVAGSCCKRPS